MGCSSEKRELLHQKQSASTKDIVSNRQLKKTVAETLATVLTTVQNLQQRVGEFGNSTVMKGSQIEQPTRLD